MHCSTVVYWMDGGKCSGDKESKEGRWEEFKEVVILAWVAR